MKNYKKTLNCILSLFCLLCTPSTVLSQTQIGADIDGEAAVDISGIGVALSKDGSKLAVGSLRNDGNGTNSGHVRVFQWSGSGWSQQGNDINGEAAEDQFGRSVSMSSDGYRLAIGATKNDGNGTDSGHVRVYQWSGSDWTQLGNDINGEVAEDGFGFSVSLSHDGNRLVIGAPYSDVNGDRSGQVRVFEWLGSDWAQLGTNIDGEAADNLSGISVSLSSDGDILALGASHNDGNGENSGHVRVYHWSGSNWGQLGTDINGEGAGDRSGGSVSLSSDGNRLAIGAPDNNANGDASGHVRVYHWSGSDWVRLGMDIDGEAPRDFSGDSVSLSSDGNRLAIGALGNDGNGESSGHVRVYQWSGSAWVQLGIDIDGEATGDNSGTVSLSSDGSRLAIGAPENDANGDASGHVRVYDLSMFNIFKINAGLNDAWYNPDTDGQGFFITVFPELNAVSLAWFTYDTELPAEGATANLGDPGHRWLLAVGVIEGNKVVMEIEMTSGGLFDTTSVVERTNPPGSDGTITLTFDNCNSGIIEYDITSINQQGTVPLQRVADDNIVLCEILNQ